MKRIILGLSIICLLFSVVGCGNRTKNIRITEQNKETVFQQIKDSKDLTAGELRMLMVYVMRDSMSSAFTGGKPAYIGKTIGEIINEQEKTEKDSQKMVEEAQKEEEKLAQQLSSTLAVAVYKKGYVPADYSSGSYDDYISLSLTINNLGAKEIRAFKGKLSIKDLFGSLISNYAFDYDKKLKPGQNIRMTSFWKCNRFVDADNKVRETNLENLKITWFPEAIIFSDGTRIGKFEDK
jgi:hypothetical protein